MMQKPTIILTLLFQFGSFHASAQEDNFDDNNSNGWTETDSIGLATGGAFPTVQFSVADGEYRIRATAASPNPGALGPARGTAFRTDVIYDGSFFLSVDVPAHDASLNQGLGFFAMAREIGPGSTDGYALAYNPSLQTLSISVVINEAPVTFLETSPLNGAAETALRLVFEGKNGMMTGHLYNLSDLTTPLSTVTGTDTTHTSGASGLFVFDYNENGDGVADATFDNYVARPRDSPLTALETWLLSYDYPLETDLHQDASGDGVSLLMAFALGLNPNINLSGSLPAPVLDGDTLGMSFHAASPGITYKVETSIDLKNWVTDGVTLSDLGPDNQRTATVAMDSPRRFLRLVVQP